MTTRDEKLVLMNVLLGKIELNQKAAQERIALAQGFLEQWKKLRDEYESAGSDDWGFCMSLSELMQEREEDLRKRPVIIPQYERD